MDDVVANDVAVAALLELDAVALLDRRLVRVVYVVALDQAVETWQPLVLQPRYMPSPVPLVWWMWLRRMRRPRTCRRVGASATSPVSWISQSSIVTKSR